MTEKEFENTILKLFKHSRNIALWKRNVGARKFDDRFIRFSEAGQSDLWGIIKEYSCPQCGKKQYGTHLEIELKVGKNKPSKLQEQWLVSVDRFNGIGFALYDTDMPQNPLEWERYIECRILSYLCPDCVHCNRLRNEFLKKQQENILKKSQE